MVNAPMHFLFRGGALYPLRRYRDRVAEEFAEGKMYCLAEYEERSQNSHNHYFKTVNEAWKQLREDDVERFPTAEHLRKWALCKCHYADERSVVCSSAAEARRVAAFVRPFDEFAVVTVDGPVVKVYTPQSQSARHMDRKTFEESKKAVISVLSELIGVDAETLGKNAGRAVDSA